MCYVKSQMREISLEFRAVCLRATADHPARCWRMALTCDRLQSCLELFIVGTPVISTKLAILFRHALRHHAEFSAKQCLLNMRHFIVNMLDSGLRHTDISVLRSMKYLVR
jgi:hypothetical protein